MTKRLSLLWLLFFLTEKKQVKVKITKHWKGHIGSDHGFNLKKIKTATTVFLRKFWQLNFVVRVLSFLDYLLSSSMCEPWSNKYKNTLKKLSLYCIFFFAENVLQTSGQVEIILKFVGETCFCCYNTAAKSKRFDFSAMLQQHLFMLLVAIILKRR